MKTKILLSLALAFSSVCAFAADENVTPSFYQFDSMEPGQVDFFKYSAKGSNPAQPYPEDRLIDGGFAVLGGGQVKTDDQTQIDGMNKGCHIVSSEFGNMLLIKGNGSTEAPELESAAALGGYLVFNMYTDKTFPVNTPVRFKFVMKVVGEPLTADAKISIFNAGGGTSAIPLPSTICYTAIDTKWWPVIADLDVSSITGIEDKLPLRMKFEYPLNCFANRAIYFAAIQFTANPSDECPEFDPTFEGWDNPDGSEASVSSIDNSATGFVTWDKQNIYLNNMKLGSNVSVYSLNGSLVKNVTVSDTFMEINLPQGFYVVKFGNKATKVVL